MDESKKPNQAPIEMQENVRRILKEGITFCWDDAREDKTIRYTDEQVDALLRGD